LAVIMATGKQGIKKRDLIRRTQWLPIREREEVLKGLEEAELAVRVVLPPGEQGGRPLTRIFGASFAPLSCFSVSEDQG
jgi:hypothetical protein